MRPPRVSIVMPVYKGGDYFRLALRSALAQRWEDLEIVVVDDGSPDHGETEAIAHEPRDPRVRYIQQDNQGVAGALNTGIAAMTGDVFCWLSHDDLFLPDKTAWQADFHARLGVPDAILFSDYDLIGPRGEPAGQVRADLHALRRHPMRALLTGSINGCTIWAPARVMREAEPFRREYRYTQDYRFWNALLRRHDFFHMPEVTVRYRVHPEQGSNRPEAVEEAEGLWIAMMDDRSEVERVQLHGSAQRFFSAMAAHLSASPYPRARAHAERRAESAAAEATLSLVRLGGGGGDAPPGAEVVGLGPEGLAAALRRTRGDYIGFLGGNGDPAPEPSAWRRRIAAMQTVGGAIGLAGGAGRERLASTGALWSSAAKPPALLLHRILLGEGFAPATAEFLLDPLASLAQHLRLHGLSLLGPDQ